MQIELGNVDWKQLREQKRTIFDLLISDKKITTEQADHLEGILSFLDDIQDKADEILGGNIVFGKST